MPGVQSIVLARSPGQHLRPDDFEVRDSGPGRNLQNGEVRVRVRWLSIDQRGLLDDTPMFGRRIRVSDSKAGRGIGEMVESRCPLFVPGDMVLGETGWSNEAIADTAKLDRLEGPRENLAHYPGFLGVSGMTALLGLEAMRGTAARDVLLVSSAAVRSTVVQLAKSQGTTVIGLTSGPAKTALVKTSSRPTSSWIGFRPAALRRRCASWRRQGSAASPGPSSGGKLVVEVTE